MEKLQILTSVIECSLARYGRELERVQSLEELDYYKGLAHADLWTYGFITGDELKAQTLRRAFNETYDIALTRVIHRLYNPSTK